jgi:hypothetical protein
LRGAQSRAGDKSPDREFLQGLRVIDSSCPANRIANKKIPGRQRPNKGKTIMSMAHDEPKLVFPGLAGFYAWASDFAYLVVRATAGGILLQHGWVKMNAGFAAISAFMTKVGFVPGGFFAGSAMFSKQSARSVL